MRQSLRATVSSARAPILAGAEQAIVQIALDMTERTKGPNYFRIRAVDLDCLKGLTQDTFGKLVELDPQQAIQMQGRNMLLKVAAKHFGPAFTQDELEIIQYMNREDLSTIVSLPPIVTQTIDPTAKKTKEDILLSLTLSSPTPAKDVVHMLFQAYWEHPKQHPVYLNTKFIKKTVENEIVLHLTIEGKFGISDRVTYMTYTLSESQTPEGLAQFQIRIKRVGASQYSLPPLKLEDNEPMVTMEGAITIVERPDGGSVMRLDVIGNPGINIVPDFVLRDILEGKYTKLGRDGAEYLAKTVFAQCLVDEFSQAATPCR